MTAEQKRQETVRLIKSREKKNSYSQARPGAFFGSPEGGKGRSDCSDSVRQCILRAAGIDIGGNTSAQIDRRGRGIVVEMAAKGQLVPTESKLQPGDLIYYKGNTSHTLDVGHVEMYIGGGKIMGHGSGIGPTVKSLASYSKGRTGARAYLCAIRWILDDRADDEPAKLGSRALSKGCKGDDVRELQAALIELGYALPKYGVDGDYGTETATAVKGLQQARGLTQTGAADTTTIKAIQAALSGQTVQTKQMVKVSGSQAHIRAGAGTGYKSLGIAANGSIWEASGEAKDGWVGVIYKGVRAWISAKYAEVV